MLANVSSLAHTGCSKPPAPQTAQTPTDQVDPAGSMDLVPLFSSFPDLIFNTAFAGGSYSSGSSYTNQIMNIGEEGFGTAFVSFPTLVRGPRVASSTSFPGGFGMMDYDASETPTDFELPLSDDFDLAFSDSAIGGSIAQYNPCSPVAPIVLTTFLADSKYAEEGTLLAELEQLAPRTQGMASYLEHRTPRAVAPSTDTTAPVLGRVRRDLNGIKFQPFGIGPELPVDVEGLFVLSVSGVTSHSLTMSLGPGALDTMLGPLGNPLERTDTKGATGATGATGGSDEFLPLDLIFDGQTLQSFVSLTSISSSPGDGRKPSIVTTSSL